MKKRIALIFIILLFILLLIKSEAVIEASTEGLAICIHSVIPSLLPFMILSSYARQILTGQKLIILSPVQKLCKMPQGNEILWLLGTLGGYPVGAHCITQAYKQGNLSKPDAERLLGFCCNCGPAFLFGIIGSIVKNIPLLCCIWIIHIFSSLLTGWILSRSPLEYFHRRSAIKTDNNALLNSLKSLSLVCTWIILFRIIIQFIKILIPISYTPITKVLLYGILELTNGSMLLGSTETVGAQFILASVLLALGGICVAIQTLTLTKNIRTHYYFLGKMIQTAICFLISYLIQPLIITSSQQLDIPYIVPILTTIFLVTTAIVFRKNSSNPKKYVV